MGNLNFFKLITLIGLFGHIMTVILAKSTVKESHSEDPFGSDDRINLNVNRGHAVAYGPVGGSISDSYSQGIQVGIRRQGMKDEILYEHSDAFANTNAFGQSSPLTYAGAQNEINAGGVQGGANAGYNGGIGYSQTDSLSQHIEIPIDPFGTVLFSNLEKKPHTNKTSHNSTNLSIQ